MTEQTEPQAGPVVKVARDLTEILRLYDDLFTQAVTNGDNPEMPGGSAMEALGGVANLEAWENMQASTERTGRAYTSAEDEDPEVAWSAFQLLEFWSEEWRREHDAEYNQRPTIQSEANFLRYLLDWAWDNEPHWDDFARDVRQARQRLENILYAGERAERTRVQCDNPQCERHPQLIKIFGATEEEDFYKCPACKAKFTAEGFQRAYSKQLRSEGAEKFVTVRDAVATLRSQGRGERTIRRWLAPALEHDHDACRVCAAEWPADEYAACPADAEGESCGGLLRAVYVGDSEAVILGYCDIRSHRALAWWPDLWHRHLTSLTRDRSA